MIGTIRRECLDYVIVMNERHARAILDEYVRYYNADRAHQALDGDAPEPRAVFDRTDGRVIATPHLGGLHHSYRRVA